MQNDSGMVFEQVVYLNSEKGKTGFEMWGSSDPLAFSPSHTRLDLSPERVSGKRGTKSGRNQKSFICGHKLGMNFISDWLWKS